MARCWPRFSNAWRAGGPGSSRRRGAQALRELATWAERGCDIAITPDGPRGPRYVLAEGATGLAQITGLPALPVSYFLKWKIHWAAGIRLSDSCRFQFAKFRWEKFFRCRAKRDEEREKLRQPLETKLRAISND